jgi:hypothetical protein
VAIVNGICPLTINLFCKKIHTFCLTLKRICLKHKNFFNTTINFFSHNYEIVSMREKIYFSVIAVAIFLLIFNTQDSNAQVTCQINVDPPLNFGLLTPSSTSGNGVSTTLTNTGGATITKLTIKGTDWQRIGGGDTIPVGQTKWALTDGKDYDTEMVALTTNEVDLGITLDPGQTQNIFFKLRIPINKLSGDYTQTITFTIAC